MNDCYCYYENRWMNKKKVAICIRHPWRKKKKSYEKRNWIIAIVVLVTAQWKWATWYIVCVCVCFTLKSRWNDATVRRTCIYIDKNLSLPVSFDFLSVSANAPPPLVCKMVFFCIIVYVCPTFFSYWIYKSFVTVLSCFMSQILFHDGKRFAKNTQTARIAMKNNKAKAKICSLLEMNRNMYDCFCLKYSIWILWNGPKMLSFPVDGNLLRTFHVIQYVCTIIAIAFFGCCCLLQFYFCKRSTIFFPLAIQKCNKQLEAKLFDRLANK